VIGHADSTNTLSGESWQIDEGNAGSMPTAL
jgi:hypothetical protein